MATIDELGLTPYQRIMGQMTPTMNPYTGADVAVGGYDPALYRRASGSGLINSGFGGLGGLGGGGGGGGDNPQPLSQQTIDFFDNETKEQRDDRMGRVNSVLQGIVNFTVPGVGLINALPSFLSSAALGRVNNALNPLGLINYDIPVEDAVPAYSAIDQNAQAMQSMQDAYNADMAAASNYGVGYNSPTADGGIGGSPADADSGAGGYSGSVGADYSSPADGGIGGSPADADAGAGGYGNNDSSYGGFYNMGGLVTNVFGPDPSGPDDGQVNIMRGEYVIKKSAVKKYGQGLLDMINDGKIPAKKMKSLLG